MKNDDLEKKIRSLPTSMRDEVARYIDYLIEKTKSHSSSEKKFSFSWEGGISELKDDFSSVELQHEANKWR